MTKLRREGKQARSRFSCPMASPWWAEAPPPCSERMAGERDYSPEAPPILSPTRLRQGATPPRPGSLAVFSALMDDEEAHLVT